ncbi:MAG: ATP-binding cassette domain-containing protein, partial [Lactobacillales bacterium]|nr:ATP-binding cassette domain-containing protein [Lactobacillales bacterium]
SGIRVVKSFANEKIEMLKFKNSSLAYVKSKRKYLKLRASLFAGMNTFVIGLIPIVATAGIYLVINHLMPVKDLITFILCVDVLIAPFFSILETCETMINAMAGYKRFINVMEIKPDIVDIDGAEELKNILGDIQFKNVVFKYKNGHKNVLENLTLKIKPKEYIALVGSSGVGKSTLCNLLPRFYDVTSGAILIDGHNVKDVTLKSLRENIGHVQQDTYLFAGTIRENIAYGKFDATEEEIINAAKNAYAHDFIMEFSKGYDTDIGQRGIKLSGGQKQRLSIARVFLKNPQILILDEATSALDNESEKFIQKSLENLSTTRTTLVIAHRLSTIKKAERILVMNHKGIVEEGNHKEFLKKGGVYTELYNMQF